MTETTARDDLEVRLIRDAGLSPHWAKRQVDAFAHELAEQQRALLRSKGTVWTGSIGQVINHIDPGEQPAVDAVPAAVPSAPADPAPILREAADGFDAHAEQILRGIDDMAAFVAKALQREAATWREAAETLRRMAGEAQQPETQAECNSGVGWYEVIHPRNATTCIAYAHEDGSLYLPEGDDLTPDEFAFAAARGNAHRLVRADEPAVGAQQPKEA